MTMLQSRIPSLLSTCSTFGEAHAWPGRGDDQVHTCLREVTTVRVLESDVAVLSPNDPCKGIAGMPIRLGMVRARKVSSLAIESGHTLYCHVYTARHPVPPVLSAELQSMAIAWQVLQS